MEPGALHIRERDLPPGPRSCIFLFRAVASSEALNSSSYELDALGFVLVCFLAPPGSGCLDPFPPREQGRLLSAHGWSLGPWSSAVKKE